MKRGKISKQDKDRAVELFTDGSEIKAIAKELDRSEEFITKVLESAAEELVEVEVEETPKLNKKPSATKTESGRGGIAVSNPHSSEQVDRVNRKVSQQTKTNVKKGSPAINHPAAFRIFSD